MSIESDYTPQDDLWLGLPVIRPGIQNGWFADVPLSAEVGTEITLCADNGQMEETRTTTWLEWNLLESPTNQICVRQNDAILWNLYPSPNSTGATQIRVDNALAYFSSNNTTWACAFTNAGTYKISGTWNPLGGGVGYNSATVIVEVVSASFGEPPVVWVGHARNWDCPDMPTNIWVEFDSAVQTMREALWPSGSRFSLRMQQAESSTALARLNGPGSPILDAVRVHGIRLQSSSALDIVRYYYADGSRIEVTSVLLDFAEGLPPGVLIQNIAVGAGIYIEDEYGEPSLSITLNPSTWGSTGLGSIVYSVAADSWSATCNSMYLEQNGQLIGNR
jgi:hypothetical protein